MDASADRLYLRMRQLIDALTQLSVTSPTYVALLNVLDGACLLIDYHEPRSMAFYASCMRALEQVEQMLHTLSLPAVQQPHVVATGHAHIDVAWLWQLRHTHMKAANTFATALYHMDRYPYFTFVHSTPQIYKWIKVEHPDLYARIQQKVAAGQWEVEGAMWVEADTNITGGESLVRQFLFGQQFFEREFGYRCKVLWLPDVFGYSAVLPQLIKAAGADHFVTTKLSWNDTNRMPNDTFWWQGLDGTRVLAYFITARNDPADRYATYNAVMKPSMLVEAWKSYRPKELNHELLVAYGWGDGGGGPTREMIEAAGNWSTPIHPDLPTTTTGHVADFMQRLDTHVNAEATLPVWDGELYFEYHRGTYTSQGRTKRANRVAERNLHDAEWLSVLAQLACGLEYPAASLRSAWEVVLTHQFHDILPGSSIGQVYQDATVNYAGVMATTAQIITASLEALAQSVEGPMGSVLCANPIPWTRDALIRLPTAQAEALDLPSQSVEDGETLVLVRDLPPLGYRVVSLAGASHGAEDVVKPAVATQHSLENAFLRIEFDDAGQISRIFDKEANAGAGREVIATGDRANVFQFFEDKPLNFDAWDIDAFYTQKQEPVSALADVAVIEQGPLRAGIQFTWRHHDRTQIVQRIYLAAHARQVDFVTTVDWQERQTLLKVAFPVAIHSGTAMAEIQFGNLQRSTHMNTSWDQARFETCAHKWFDFSERGYGVAILNDSKYGYDVHGRTLRLTLLKGAVSPDPTADLGQHSFTYALLPHSGDWFSGNVHRAAYALNDPVLVVTKSAVSESHADVSLPVEYSLVESDSPNIVVETVKRSESGDAVVLRLYECANARGPVRLRLAFPAASAQETNLLEEPVTPVTLLDDGYILSFEVLPYQIKTLVITPR